MSEPAAKAAARATTEQRSLENEGILRQVLVLLIGQGVFVRTVAKDWLKSYESVIAEAAPVFGQRMRADLTLYEAAFSSVKCVELAHECGMNLNSMSCIQAAGKHADIVTLQRAGELGMMLRYAVESALGDGRLDVLKWLHIDQKHPLPYRPDEDAARSGHAREVLQWLKEIGEVLTEHATCSAAEAGDIDALEYLHVEQGIRLLSDIYKIKDLPTLKWLHAHNGLTVAQLNSVAVIAAADNELSTLQWTKSVGAAFTDDTIRAAVHYGHLDMVEYLVAEHPAFNRTECYEHAVHHGQMYILKWLDAQYGSIANDVDYLSSAASEGHLEVCQYLREQGYQ
jgi:hypothetical protein